MVLSCLACSIDTVDHILHMLVHICPSGDMVCGTVSSHARARQVLYRLDLTSPHPRSPQHPTQHPTPQELTPSYSVLGHIAPLDRREEYCVGSTHDTEEQPHRTCPNTPHHQPQDMGCHVPGCLDPRWHVGYLDPRWSDPIS